MNHIQFKLNGKDVVITDLPPTTTLLYYLRDHLGLTGTKEGCNEGDCGACTVAVIDTEAVGGPAFRAVNACLVLLPMVQGKQVFTVEALRGPDALHPAQQHMVDKLGSQCGYCTPGIVMSLFEATYRRDLDEPWKLDDQLAGNLCRCTGYRPIRDAATDVAGTLPEDRFAAALAAAAPPSMELGYRHGEQLYFNPATLPELWELLDEHPTARFVVGGTDLSLEVTKRFEAPPLLISLEGIDGLRRIERADDALVIGATTPLSDLEVAVKDDFPAIERMLRFFGARQIKNRGTLGGNLCNASPIGDMAPVLLSLGAEAVLRSRDRTRTLPLQDFFLDYRKTALMPSEILAAVRVPWTPPGDVRSIAYKVSKRQELDISAISAGLCVELDDQQRVVLARLAFGGMAATPKRAALTEAALIGQPWSEDTVEAALGKLDEDFAPLSDHRGSAWYRSTVAKNLLRGFFLETALDPRPRLPYRPTGTVIVEAGS